MGDVITWSKLNKIKKLISNLPTSLENNFNGVKESISALANNFNTWKAPWTTARAEKIDTVTANSETIKNTADTINTGVTAIQNIPLLQTGAIKSIQRGYIKKAELPYNDPSIKINISPVNIEKSFIIANYVSSADASPYQGVFTIQFTKNNTITLQSVYTNSNTNVTALSWQVIEFN